ncbi:MAG: autotransporter assembly complex protein TamA [Desulfuromonadaceae bacterium]|nr:autotransporter assembly complex protein TamA [Desulfuromonadaceae bacterium]MDD5106999.1 autotransporter assembly complex protein TamA [Desulfuromonadaceae bacterium]
MEKAIHTALALLILWLILATPLYAAEQIEIVITGIEGDALKNVQESLVIPAEQVRDETVDKVWLNRFSQQAVHKTRVALEPFGYYNALVTVMIEGAGDGSRMLVTVVPGEPVRLTSVTVTLTGQGHDERSLLTAVEAFPLKKGDVLLQHVYEETKGALISRARDFGYLNAEFSRHEIRISRGATTAVIELVLNTGDKYLFGETHFHGAPDYPGSFLRRHLTYRSGEPFSYTRLGETQRNLTNSERFTEVTITPEKQDADALMVPVTIQLKERPAKSLRPGIGYGTDTGARFTVRYRDLNMFHLGHELYSQLFVAERLQGLVTGYIIPSPTDVRSSTTFQLNLQQEDTTAYSSRIAALELARNRSFGTGTVGTAYIKAQYEEYSVGIQDSTSRLLLPGLRFIDDRYDNPVRPHRGFRYALDLHGTHQVLGSDTALVQILAEGSYLLPLPWRLSLHTRAKVGTTLLNDPLRDIPPSFRFFAGGDQSVRGYSYKSLGPRDASGNVVGGTQLLTSSIELHRAILKDWGVSIFFDAGNAANSFSNFSIFQGAGVGLHYFTSVGTLNLSVARPLGVDNPSIHFHFTVGFEL